MPEFFSTTRCAIFGTKVAVVMGAVMTLFCTPLSLAQQVVYVDHSADGAGDGTTWSDAFPFLQDAFDTACLQASSSNPVEIWVAQGQYLPDESFANPAGTGDRAASFELCSYVSVIGGFAGGEQSITQRDPESNATVLSGDLAADDTFPAGSNTENTYHIIRCATGGDETALDGFIVTGGNALGSSTLNGGGPAILLTSGDLSVRRCLFIGHTLNPDPPMNERFGAVMMLSGDATANDDLVILETVPAARGPIPTNAFVQINSVPPPCPADVNGDGLATPADFTAWLSCFNNPAQPGCSRADIDNSGAITPADFTAWLAAFSQPCP